jgi:hypothetical protein
MGWIGNEILALVSDEIPATAVSTAFWLGVASLLCLGLFGFIQWATSSRIHTEPWGDAIQNALADEESEPLCLHCLWPQAPLDNFCPHCGAPVGQYTNYLPFPYIFSVGNALRNGTNGEFRHSWWIIFGFFLFGVVEYAFFAPVYWFVFFRKLFKPRVPPALPLPSEVPNQ